MKTIEEFIDDFRMRENDYIPTETNDAEEIIRHLFRSGYCYYFAHMLSVAYPGGQVCWACPTSHWVYKYNGKAYDIEGEYVPREFDCDVLIPLQYVSPVIVENFMHRGVSLNTDKIMVKANEEKYLSMFPQDKIA